MYLGNHLMLSNLMIQPASFLRFGVVVLDVFVDLVKHGLLP